MTTMIRTIKNALADALAVLDRNVVKCRWRWLCQLPARLWQHDFDNFE
jgi:hypothetical protein